MKTYAITFANEFGQELTDTVSAPSRELAVRIFKAANPCVDPSDLALIEEVAAEKARSPLAPVAYLADAKFINPFCKAS